MKNRVDVTIIGGGPTGLFASFYAGLRGMSVRIIESLSELGGQLSTLYPEKPIYDMPGFPEILAKDLAQNLIKQGTQFEPDLVVGETAEELIQDDQGYVIRTQADSHYPTKTLIIAAGAGAFRPVRLGAVGEEQFENSGVYYKVSQISHFKDKSLVIIGGGDSAFDWALTLAPIARQIKLIHRRDHFRAHEETVRKVKESCVEFCLSKVVKEFAGNGRLQSVVVEDLNTNSLDTYSADAAIINAGFKSSIGPLKSWGLTIEKNHIIVGKYYESNLPGVFVIGDVAGYEGKIKLIATGMAEAAEAVCYIKTLLDPSAKLFPGHSSDMDLDPLKHSI